MLMQMMAQARAHDPCVSQRITPLARADIPAWERFLVGRPRASLYHSARWAALIEGLFGHETHYWLARDPLGQVSGVLPLLRLKSRLFGDYLVSMPYFNYGGAIGNTPAIEAGLMRAAAERASSLGIAHIEFRDSHRRDGDWPTRRDKVVMQLALPADASALWKAVGSKLRAQIRRPQKEGAQVLHGGIELLDEFYAVFSRNMRDLGTPVYPRRFFAAIAETFAEQTTLVVVRYQGAPVAAGFLLGHGDRIEIPWASSLKQHNRLGVNMLLYWHALETAIERGYTLFDFGRSSIDSGTYRFKEQWGAQPEQLFWHYWLGEQARMPDLTPTNPKFRLAVQAWRRLPLGVANWLGPHIVKNLP